MSTLLHILCASACVCVCVCVWPLTSCVLTGFVTVCGLEWHRYFYRGALRMQVCVFCLSVCLSAEAFSHSRYCNLCYSRESWRSVRKLCRPPSLSLSLSLWQFDRHVKPLLLDEESLFDHIQWTTSWYSYSSLPGGEATGFEHRTFFLWGSSETTATRNDTHTSLLCSAAERSEPVYTLDHENVIWILIVVLWKAGWISSNVLFSIHAAFFGIYTLDEVLKSFHRHLTKV